jgi:hypothetical protein
MSKVFYVQLNEIMFDLVHEYHHARLLYLPQLECISREAAHTDSENRYELLEPWIQWHTAATGKTADESGVRVLHQSSQAVSGDLFSRVRQMGVSVGSISYMNFEPSDTGGLDYYCPDPWSSSKAAKPRLLAGIGHTIAHLVNNNIRGHSLPGKSILFALFSIIFVKSPIRLLFWKNLITGVVFRWRRAIALDVFLFSVAVHYSKRLNTGFNSVFLNAGAHIQHHYLFASRALRTSTRPASVGFDVGMRDPVAEVYQAYEKLIATLMQSPSVIVVVATALSQVPCEKPVYYWRLADPRVFLSAIGLAHIGFQQLMSRDIFFLPPMAERQQLLETLKSMNIGGIPLFGEFREDGGKIFCTLTYGGEINSLSQIHVEGRPGFRLNASSYLGFVAVKNGQHSPKGYYWTNSEKFIKSETFHLTELPNRILGVISNLEARD